MPASVVHLSRGSTSKVLLVAFDPFGGKILNSSWLAIQALHGKQIARHRIIAAQLPTAFKTSLQILRKLIAEHNPALIIGVGQADMRSPISLERVAINIIDARIPDNQGVQPVDEEVISGGPVGYFSTLPIKAIRTALNKADVPVEISQTAGSFVCNYVFYGLMHELSTRKLLRRTRGGFIHVPLLPQQSAIRAAPAMPLEQIVKGLRLAIQTTLKLP
ncbi:MAG: pyroglutamyl-peptidase I [Alphaproteobacteria bacterium]|nr:pyroglutamyl-peptidase I [Alphaproteobacteria bacterium]